MGAALAAHFESEGDDVTATTRRSERVAQKRPFLDLREPSERWPRLSTDVAFFCASETSVSRCEADPVGTRAINVTACVDLARGLLGSGAFVCIPSSTLVFSGERAGYSTDEEPSPACEYGRQKAALEEAMLALGSERVGIVRVGKIVSAQVPLFRDWMSALRLGGTIRAFEDMVMAPVALSAVCEVFARLADMRTAGILHFTASEDLSYVEAARILARELEVPPERVRSERRPPSVVAAPAHTMLDSTATRAKLGIEIPDPQTAIRLLTAAESPI